MSKSNAGVGVTEKTRPNEKVCFLETLNMNDKMLQLDFIFLTIARSHEGKQKKKANVQRFYICTYFIKQLVIGSLKRVLSFRLSELSALKKRKTSKCGFWYIQHKNHIVLFACFLFVTECIWRHEKTQYSVTKKGQFWSLTLWGLFMCLKLYKYFILLICGMQASSPQ